MIICEVESSVPREVFIQQQSEQQQQHQQVDNPNLRRSERIKNNKNKNINTAKTTTKETPDNNTNPQKEKMKIGTITSIKKHIVETGHNMDWKNFNVVCQKNHHFCLLIKESLLIQAFQPELNKTTHSVPLIVFPDGLPKKYLPDPNR